VVQGLLGQTQLVALQEMVVLGLTGTVLELFTLLEAAAGLLALLLEQGGVQSEETDHQAETVQQHPLRIVEAAAVGVEITPELVVLEAMEL
jgi:hypothetical protein